MLRPEVTEITALGAAYLTGLAVEFWNDKDEIMEKWNLNRLYVPKLEEEKRTTMYKGWKKAVTRSQS